MIGASPRADPAFSSGREPIRLGAIGVDSSHLPEFTRRINALNDAGESRCRVIAFFDPGDHQMPAADVTGWRKATSAMGVREFSSLDTLSNEVDGALILSVSGFSHAKLALPFLRRGIPTYIDKPLTCNLSEAKELLVTARAHDTPCYSASSLRFAAEIPALDRAQLGSIQVISAFGSGQLNPAMPGLFYYGVHTIEMVDAIWGPGVCRVRTTSTQQRDLVELEYADGRFAQLRMERRAHYDFGATVHGSDGVTSFRIDFSTVYDRMIAAMVRFFEGGNAPVALRDTLENIAVMEAGNLSVDRLGQWITLPSF